MEKGVKVFISSTFRDLDNERDYIVKSIFPRIINELNGKLVHEVDLRWGITEEQANSGLVVDLCLRYLLNSKPFIIGILGDRYGSSFSKDGIHLSPIVKSAFPNLEQQLDSGKSITEIEIINGALESEDKDIKAIFFIKETSAPAPGETIEQYNKLCALKRKIREQERFPVYTYNTLLDFDNIIEFITQGIPAEHKKSTITDLEKAVYHTQNRLKNYRSSTIHDHSILKEIYNHVETGVPISIVEGNPGIGKSTLMAHLGLNKEYKFRRFIHFYGDSLILPLSIEMFQKYFFDFASHILREEDTRVAKYEQYLVSAISRTKWCFVIDNISNGATEMLYLSDVIKRFAEWMKTRFGTNLDYKILIIKNTDTSIPGNICNVAPIYRLRPGKFFNPKEFIDKYMAEYSKCLNPQQVNLLKSSKAAKTPMSLELICHFLRENVSFDKLNDFIMLFSVADSWKDVIELYMDNLFKNCDKKDIKAIVTMLCTYSAPLNRREMIDCCNVSPLSFNVIMSYMDKMLDSDNDGRIKLINNTVKESLIELLNISKDDIRSCAKETFRYFNDKSKNLYTQEDFMIDSTDKFWAHYRYWESVIPKCYYWRYPRIAEGNALGGKSFGVSSLLGLCGGTSYENSHRAYYQFLYGIFSTYVARCRHFNRKHSKGETTNEEVEKHQKWLEDIKKKISNFHNPNIYDVIHSLESLMWTESYDMAKHILTNPPYANRIIETSYFSNFWKQLRSNGYDLKDVEIRENTLFANSGYHNMALLLNDMESAEFYTPRRKFEFKYSEEWLNQYLNDTKHEEHECKEFKNARYRGKVDFFGRPHKSGYIEYINEDFSIDSYVGEFKRSKPHGNGIFIYANGTICEGEWRKGFMHGEGVIAYPNGTIYEGDFVDNKWNGRGRYIFTNGDLYEGEVKNNKFEGKGKYTWVSGSWIEGIWKDSKIIEQTAKHYNGQDYEIGHSSSAV